MFPLKVDDTVKKIPGATLVLIIVCCVVHWYRQRLFPEPGLVPLDIVHSLLHADHRVLDNIISGVTSFFIHGSLLHLAGNVWYLWVFGSALEQTGRRSTFVAFYLLFGVVAMGVQVANDPLSSIPVVGASGAIAGIMGMYMVLRPFARIVVWVPPIFFPRVPAVLFLIVWFWLQWYSAHSCRVVQSNVAWWAHIGGFVAGSAVGVITAIRLRRKSKNIGRKKNRRR